MMDAAPTFDSIVIGGGPAGLSAALLLGRCRRSVAVFDEGRPRNEMAGRVNGFLGAPSVSPKGLLDVGRLQAAEYPSVTFFDERVEEASHDERGFTVVLSSGAKFRSRSLIVATGLIDRLPEIPGMAALYGKSVFPCPYCDGWENAGRKLGAYGSGRDAANLALELGLWSDRVFAFLTEPLHDARLARDLSRRGVLVYEAKATALIGDGGRLAAVRLIDGRTIPCEALFLVGTQVQHHDFLERMGCTLGGCEQVESDDAGRTGVPGLFVAGNAKKGLQMAMVAAADGIKSAAAANEWLLEGDTAE